MDKEDARKQTLAQLFGSRSQLLVYHFMFGPNAEVGCRSCSFWADHLDACLAHLSQRDVSLVVVSRGALAKLAPRATVGSGAGSSHPI